MHRRPLVLARDGKRDGAGRLQLGDVGQEVSPRRGGSSDAGRLEEGLVVPDADHSHVPGNAVLLALVGVDPQGTWVDRVLPGRDVRRDVLELARVGLSGHGSAAPRLEEIGHVAGLQLSRELGLEGLVLQNRDLDGHVRMGRVVGVSDRLEHRLAWIRSCDVPPVDRDRRAGARPACARHQGEHGAYRQKPLRYQIHEPFLRISVQCPRSRNA